MAPRGLHNGLKRACRQLDLAHTHVVVGLVAVAEADLPSPSPPASDPAPDPLARAWADGTPADALAWVAAAPPGPGQQRALGFTQAACGAPIPELIACFTELHQATDPDDPLGGVLELCLASGALWIPDPGASLRWSRALLDRAEAGGDGLALAAAALTGAEAHYAAHDPQAAEALRRRAGLACRALGADGAVSLLARWTPPEDPSAPGQG